VLESAETQERQLLETIWQVSTLKNLRKASELDLTAIHEKLQPLPGKYLFVDKNAFRQIKRYFSKLLA